MNLAIFDIDGTLTESNEVDEACYVQAFRDVLGIRQINTNWLDYTYQTDSGLALEICRKHLLRDPCETELRQLQSRFVELLQTAVDSGQPIREIRGAASILSWLGAFPQWNVAIATGGWGKSARFKLGSARLPVDAFPWANADDALDRADILRLAIGRAKETYGRDDYDRIVYFGDAVWDVRAAKALGLGFIGIAVGDSGARLLEEGASCTMSDFSDLARVGECLGLAARILRDGAIAVDQRASTCEAAG